ncbi:hypothetical protein [Spongiivirga citrea]|uniref:Uncharacterized protein n=1 Tax=Spongiivirga citrea TaxID=1481457 RepID=A0A6M0CEY5_9FLAO|nr:hypothetical protein [Spongiivirga citrea]NER16398.1 hypothetical protein [Spongiivirga citrea]
MNHLINLKPKLVMLFVATTLVFSIPTAGQSYKQKKSKRSVSVNNSSGKTTIKYSNGTNRFELEYEGDITLSDDDSDVVAISSGGYFDLRKSTFGNRRRILIESDRNGRLLKEYYVGRKQQAFTPEGKKWLSEVLIDIVRSTTISAEARVNRFYKKGGVDAVLDEIDKIDSDHVKTAYFEYTLEKDLNKVELVKVIKMSGREVSSDHYLSNILVSNQEAFLSSPETTSAYISASGSLGSDHYKTKVLNTAIKNGNINNAQLRALLEMTNDIGSDHYLSQVLLTVLKERDLDAQNTTSVIKHTKSIGSDHYKSQVLMKALSQRNISKEAYNSFIETIDDISSDHYMTQVIGKLMNNDFGDENLDRLLDVATNNVSSDHYLSSMLKKLVKNNDLTDVQLTKVLQATRSIGSDHYASSLLVAIAPKIKTESSREAYRTAAKSISSDLYYGRALKALN